MASAQQKTESGLSFARVAAVQGKENATLSYAKMAATNLAHSSWPANAAVERTKEESNGVTSNAEGDTLVEGAHEEQEQLVEALKTVALTPSLIVNGSGTASSESTGIFGNGSPDMFRRTDSLSDLGTKPPSLDGKSITSGTTFALDEKESLRPDDSASVKAAEDDDTFSGRGSIVAGSRTGSEAAARAYRSQVYEASERKAMGCIPLEPQPEGIITPQSGSSGPQIAGENAQRQLNGAGPVVDGFHMFYKKAPDDKLLEAMESPKDRIFLLRLEQDFVSFVKDTKEPYFDVPPSNSFCRMLTHKLADYYHLTHSFDPQLSTVRIFRTPFCRLPETLSTVSNPPTSGNTPPAAPTMKILRRGGDNGSQSKPNSEYGADGKEKSQASKERMSREEKEAHYHAARERIFGNLESKSGDVTPDEEGNGMSRSSSLSGKTKTKPTRRKQRNDSDSFDVRSAYRPIFEPEAQAMYQQQWQQQQPMMVQYSGVSYGQKGAYPPQPMSGNMAMPQMAYGNQQAAAAYPMNQAMSGQGVSYQPSLPAFAQQQMMQSPPQPTGPWLVQAGAYSQQQIPPQMQQQMQPMQSLQQSIQQPQQYTRGSMSGPGLASGGTIPYPYGQLPNTANPADPKSQHPIPGSFNRHAFNPKTQSFVPGNVAMGQQPVMQQHQAYGGYGMGGMGQGMQQQFGYQMSRQSSNASIPSSYHASPHMAPRPLMMQGMAPQMAQMGSQMQPGQIQQGMVGGAQISQMQGLGINPMSSTGQAMMNGQAQGMMGQPQQQGYYGGGGYMPQQQRPN